ncbi:MAG: ATP-binding protein [Anaerolinea sp.]|nr:ATP-binding protein [Anaerolinea sp.]
MAFRVFPGDYASLAEIATFVRQVSIAAGFDSNTVYQIETAVDEACSNIIEHAYGGEHRGDIECQCEITAHSLTITLKDHGKPFRPDKIAAPDLKAPLKKRQAHGLGLYFMRQWMDEVHFEFMDGVNVLTLIKHLPG